MTNASMNAQTRPAAQPTGVPFDGANDNNANGFDPNVVQQVAGKATSLKPADSSWNHCDVANGSAASVTPGKVTPVAVPSTPFKK
ncbi:MAG TPA: hypothetical protein VGT24_06340 [Candidatus Acidoferrales bacterium]|nr:hypothetical protein [Candidatus Acidoferrales bacterium]